jgi:hypothetical protein
MFSKLIITICIAFCFILLASNVSADADEDDLVVKKVAEKVCKDHADANIKHEYAKCQHIFPKRLLTPFTNCVKHVEKTKQVRELVCYENHPHSGEVSYRYKI